MCRDSDLCASDFRGMPPAQHELDELKTVCNIVFAAAGLLASVFIYGFKLLVKAKSKN